MQTNQATRISDVTQQWFLTEPLLFGAWTTHQVVTNSNIDTIRVGRGRIEFNPAFVASLDQKMLREVMKFETLRIILKHPYERRKPNREFALTASNIAINECIASSLPMPTAESTFETGEHGKKYFEYYYNLLVGSRGKKSSDEDDEQSGDLPSEDKNQSEDGHNDEELSSSDANAQSDDDSDEPKPDGECSEDSDQESCDSEEKKEEESDEGLCKCGNGCKPGECPCGDCDGSGTSKGNSKKSAKGNSKAKSDGGSSTGRGGDFTGGKHQKNLWSGDGERMEDLSTSPSQIDVNSLGNYCDAEAIYVESTEHWDDDQFVCEQINDLITEIESSQNWGTFPGDSRELILATRKPKLDYRKVLKSFRANVLSTNRRLTRMKPSRRYGFEYMGSRRDFATHLLFAVDVSGSVSSLDVSNAFSIVNRLFKYGIESIDVIWFDTEVRNEKPITLKKARSETAILGRGGTDFQPVMDYLDEHRDYDGLIVFTDGYAPIPLRPKRNRRTRVAWLFNHEENWRAQHKNLEQPGMVSAFVYAD